MKKYFTKEYVKECDCEEIQKQKEQLDYCCDVALKIDNDKYEEKIYKAFSKGKNNNYLLSSNWTDVASGVYKRSRLVWLPTGDQLDEEIVKICTKKHYTYFRNNALCNDYAFNGLIVNPNEFLSSPKYQIGEETNKNPPIAKILLLKELIKDER